MWRFREGAGGGVHSRDACRYPLPDGWFQYGRSGSAFALHDSRAGGDTVRHSLADSRPPLNRPLPPPQWLPVTLKCSIAQLLSRPAVPSPPFRPAAVPRPRPPPIGPGVRIGLPGGQVGRPPLRRCPPSRRPQAVGPARVADVGPPWHPAGPAHPGGASLHPAGRWGGGGRHSAPQSASGSGH